MREKIKQKLNAKTQKIKSQKSFRLLKKKQMCSARENVYKIREEKMKGSYNVLLYRKKKFDRIKKRLEKEQKSVNEDIKGTRQEAHRYMGVEKELAKKLEKVKQHQVEVKKQYFKNFKVRKVKRKNACSITDLIDWEPFENRRSKRDLFKDLSDDHTGDFEKLIS